MFRIRPGSGEPIYLQLIRQIKHVISTGQMNPGDRLPAVRTLATQLVVNPNTVARAYRELERAGLLETKRGGGTFVCPPAQHLLPSERYRRLVPFLDQVITEAWALGLTQDELRTAFEERLALQTGGAPQEADLDDSTA